MSKNKYFYHLIETKFNYLRISKTLTLIMKYVFTVLGVIFFITASAQDIRDAKRGWEYQKKKRYREAIDSYTKYIDQFPVVGNYSQNYKTVLRNRADCYADAGKIDSALSDYTEVIQIEGKESTVYIARGNIYAGLNLYEKAASDFTAYLNSAQDIKSASRKYKIIKSGDVRAPNGGDDDVSMTLMALNHRAFANYSLKKYDSVLVDCYRALKIYPANPYALIFAGDANLALGRYLTALQLFLRATELEPRNVTYWTHLGFCYSQANNFEMSIKAYSKCIDIDPKDTSAYNNRGLDYAIMRKYDLAAADFNKAIEINPKASNTLLYRCLLSTIQGNYNSALSDAEQIVNPPTRAFYKIVLNIDKNDFKAASEIKLDFKGTPIDSILYDDYLFMKKYIIAGTRYLPEKKYDEALKYLLESVNDFKLPAKADSLNKDIFIYDNYANVLAKTGWVYEQVGEQQTALSYYKKAQIFNPLVQNVSGKIDSLNKLMQAERDTDKTGPQITLLKLTRDLLNSVNPADLKKNKPFYVSGICKDISDVKWIKINGNDIGALSNEGFFGIYTSLTNGSVLIEAADSKGNISSQSFKPGDRPAESNSLSEKIREVSERKQVFHAVVIACSNYPDQPLPVNIAEADRLENLLTARYGFLKSNITELYNRPSKEILFTLSSKLQALKDEDDLLIFYAGHGTYGPDKDGSNIGYWAPTSLADTTSFISSQKLDTLLEHTNVRHILILADACMGAAMMGNQTLTPPEKMANRLKSRQILTSTSWEETPSDGYFIGSIINALESNPGNNMMVTDLKNIIGTSVKKNHGTTPLLNNFGLDGHNGGQFFFIRN